MVLLQAAQISKSFGSHRVFAGLNLTVQEGEKAGIVGVNGAGKSTLLKILTGSLAPDTGEVTRVRGLSLSYLAQDGGLESGRSIWDEMLTVFTPLIDMEKKLRAMERQMSETSPRLKAQAGSCWRTTTIFTPCLKAGEVSTTRPAFAWC